MLSISRPSNDRQSTILSGFDRRLWPGSEVKSSTGLLRPPDFGKHAYEKFGEILWKAAI